LIKVNVYLLFLFRINLKNSKACLGLKSTIYDSIYICIYYVNAMGAIADFTKN